VAFFIGEKETKTIVEKQTKPRNKITVEKQDHSREAKPKPRSKTKAKKQNQSQEAKPKPRSKTNGEKNIAEEITESKNQE